MGCLTRIYLRGTVFIGPLLGNGHMRHNIILSDGTSVLMLVEDILRNIMFFSRFEYHMFYVLYPFVTYLLILPRRSLSVEDTSDNFIPIRTLFYT
jgi:TRAP-type mannitol/chloroaromatic compound transport system permease small subunit